VYPHGTAVPPADAGWITLALLPQESGRPLVFGDGSHPTTRLCAAAVDWICRQRHPEAVLDVGTGTGLLARIARARGARFIVGTDIDPAALSSANAHSALDAHPIEIHFSAEAPDHWSGRFDVVVANILEAPLRSLAAALSGALRPGGLLLISGFTRPQLPTLRLAYEKLGLNYAGHSNCDEWTLLMFATPPNGAVLQIPRPSGASSQAAGAEGDMR
jgi:ribosomal protein L11 methylase PrmA